MQVLRSASRKIVCYCIPPKRNTMSMYAIQCCRPTAKLTECRSGPEDKKHAQVGGGETQLLHHLHARMCLDPPLVRLAGSDLPSALRQCMPCSLSSRGKERHDSFLAIWQSHLTNTHPNRRPPHLATLMHTSCHPHHGDCDPNTKSKGVQDWPAP